MHVSKQKRENHVQFLIKRLIAHCMRDKKPRRTSQFSEYLDPGILEVPSNHLGREDIRNGFLSYFESQREGKPEESYSI